MAVDDHGLEVLKKAAEEVTPGSKANYYIKVDPVPGGIGDPSSGNVTNTRPTVNTGSTTILAANASRKFARIFNQSGAVVYLKYTDPAVVGQGFRLPNDQEHIIDSTKLFTGAITAIRNAGSGEIEVVEGT